jgi:hypothetical protein
MSDIPSQICAITQAWWRLFMHVRVQKFMISMGLQAHGHLWVFSALQGGDLADVPKFAALHADLRVKEWSKWAGKFRKLL